MKAMWRSMSPIQQGIILGLIIGLPEFWAVLWLADKVMGHLS